MKTNRIEEALAALIDDGATRLSELDLMHAQTFALALLAIRAEEIRDALQRVADCVWDDQFSVRSVSK